MLRYFSTIKILNAQVINYLKHDRKTRQRKVNTVSAFAYEVLYIPINGEDEKRLDEQVNRHQKYDIGKEFSIHNSVKSFNYLTHRYEIRVFKIYFIVNQRFARFEMQYFSTSLFQNNLWRSGIPFHRGADAWVYIRAAFRNIRKF